MADFFVNSLILLLNSGVIFNSLTVIDGLFYLSYVDSVYPDDLRAAVTHAKSMLLYFTDLLTVYGILYSIQRVILLLTIVEQLRVLFPS